MACVQTSKDNPVSLEKIKPKMLLEYCGHVSEDKICDAEDEFCEFCLSVCLLSDLCLLLVCLLYDICLSVCLSPV
jgi:hypothetical protein